MKKLACILAALTLLNAALISCAADGTTDSGDKESPSVSDSVSESFSESEAEQTSESESESEIPDNTVAGYTVFAFKEGKIRFEAEEADVTHYKKSGDNPTIVVEREDASGGKFLAAATGAVDDSQYFEFSLVLDFNAEISMTAAYAQTNKWKSYDEDMTESYTYIVDGNRNMMISQEKTVLKAREDITKWETFSYTPVTLPAGDHTFRVKVAKNTGKGNPNIDYLDFEFIEKDYVSEDDENVPEGDFHSKLQYDYLSDSDFENVTAYANGIQELSRPKGNILDFSADVADSSAYVLQYSSSPDFSAATTIEGLNKKQYRLYNLKLGETVYWRAGTTTQNVKNGKVHTLTVSSRKIRNLYIDGVTNVRDIGGYKSSLAENGRIRQGLYFRGANIDFISADGKKELLRLGVKQEIDLRDAYQCGGPYVSGINYTAVFIPSGTEGTRFEGFADEYKIIFGLIAKADKSPVYLHCTAGADRTGICTFMLLTLCGADYEDIARDYLFTNFSTHGSRASNYQTEFKKWWTKLDAFDGETKADKAKSWLISKGIPEEQTETIRKIFVENY